MLVLISNLKGWRARTVSIIVALVVGGFVFIRRESSDKKEASYLQNATHGEFMMGNYENFRAKGDYLLSTIQSDIVSDSYLKVFLKDISVFDNMKESPYNNKEIKWDQQKSDSSSFYINKWLSVRIDSSTFHNLSWVNAQHPVERVFGFYTYIDIATLARGSHKLIITADTARLNKKEKWAWENSDYHEKLLANINFQYDKQ